MIHYQLIGKDYYKIIATITLPRNIIAIIVEIDKPYASQFIDTGIKKFNTSFPVGCKAVYLSNRVELPSDVSFFPKTKSLNVLKKRIKKMKDALNYPHLEVTLKGINMLN